MISNFNWKDKNVLVTGGASFIGSHLVDRLAEKGAYIKVVDNLSSGKIENLKNIFASDEYIEFIKADLRDPGVARRALEGVEIVFHLAADHGGRGYVDLHQAGPASNLLLDGAVFFRSRKSWSGKNCFCFFRLRLSQFSSE